jgi:hypothetical protein
LLVWKTYFIAEVTRDESEGVWKKKSFAFPSTAIS